jgi:hypothetical protein
MTKSVIHDTGRRPDEVGLKSPCYPRMGAIWLALPEKCYTVSKSDEIDEGRLVE